jgi:hypothetical protein
MQNTNNQTLDKWEQNLLNEKQKLQLCQKEKNLQSCTPCEKFFDCEIRKEYVKTVYESMNKGSGGGFEF